jgi:uncharacterized membrane protein YsdA (DUF1294 family)
MKLIQNIFYTYGIAINCFAYALMWYDKHQAKKKENRISENKLFFIALIFGAIGIYLGMKAPIYHKAAKVKFKWGIPFLIALNVVAFMYVLDFARTDIMFYDKKSRSILNGF